VRGSGVGEYSWVMAKPDYYQVLGVARTATADEIRKAYRKLARQFHPDVNKSADASKKFNEVQEAYDILSDEPKRKMYDQVGHADFRPQGAGGGAPHYTWSNVGGGGARNEVDSEDLGSMFEAFFGGRGGNFGGGGMGGMGGGRGRAGRRPGRATSPAESPPVETQLDVAFMTAVKGGTERLRIDAGGKVSTIDVTIPKGIADGGRLRVKGGGGIGDVILKVRIGEHPLFRRTESRGVGGAQGLDLYLDLPLTIAEATLGATVPVPTLDGTLELTVPPGTASGRKLRLRGRGIEDAKGVKGDLYAIAKIAPPDGRSLTPEEAAALRGIAARFPGPRAGHDWPDHKGDAGR